MIISVSYRTDIPAFYGTWFRHRLEAGYALVENPYGSRPYRVDLGPEAADGFVFWSRNMAPFMDHLAAVSALDLPFIVQFTLTGYPRSLETSVPGIAAGVRQIGDLAARYGPRAVVWRYDPVVFTDDMEAAFHRRHFAAIARDLAGAVDEVCVSFAHIYAKTRRNLDARAKQQGFRWHDPEIEEKRRLRHELTEIAGHHGLSLTVCSQGDVGGLPAACIDVARLSDVAGRPVAARQKGNRPGCLCAKSRDIGAYDTCPHGCAYCYAVSSRSRARSRHGRHDPEGEFLLPPERRAEKDTPRESVSAQN